ncbi:G-patch domain-containing protein [Meloidogyne graminicola]|uniref:G patch domain-containing protein 11 n=1 Tax=Meloidogyne graminicola TaxID=189291 RepID=A0A8S9ZFJ0_9BILA|nr:G-patch domain-containing protein [Meloidogyne graminicola]
MERIRREEGISQPIGSESKRFKLFSLMGYKPGMSLGVKREGWKSLGIKEPIAIQIKSNRSGVGHEEEQNEKQRERCEAHMEFMKKRARMEESLATDFRNKKRMLAVQKQIISDIQQARSACHQMDLSVGKEVPEHFWFWPIYSSKLPNVNDTEEDDEEEEEEQLTYTYSNGRVAPVEVNFYQMDENELDNSLNHIIGYLRREHFYCVWCGYAYSDSLDIENTCPGSTRSAHDE